MVSGRIKHAAVAYGTVTQKATNELFTTPGSMAGDVIEWAYSTGELNLNATDVAADDGEALTSTYVVKMDGKKACQHLARQIWKEIRQNWRTDMQPRGLLYPVLISNNPIPIDESLGVFRQTIEVQFSIYNIGEGL